jgi:hypothetical protein
MMMNLRNIKEHLNRTKPAALGPVQIPVWAALINTATRSVGYSWILKRAEMCLSLIGMVMMTLR